MHYPPGPTDWFLGLGLLPTIRDDAMGFFVRMQREHGDVSCMRFGPYLDYTFFHPDAIRELLVVKAKQFVRFGPVMRVLSQWNGESVLITEGEAWQKQRRMLQPAFSGKRFAGYAEMMVATIAETVGRWEERLAAEGKLELEIGEAMTGLTMQIIARTMFGVEVASLSADLGKAVAILSEVAVSEMSNPVVMPDWMPLPGKAEKRWAMQLLDETIWGFVRQRRASGEDRGDLLSMLLHAVDESGGGGMTDEQVRNEVMTMFMAGHDTTAAALSWIWYNLARHDDVRTKTLAEIDRVLDGRPPRFEDLARLEYTQQVIDETLRLYPPAIGVFPRTPTVDVEIGGYTIPAGSICRAFSFVTQRDERWFPDPLRFDPDRFTPQAIAARPQFAYFPFGGGPRICIGEKFALMEMILVIATTLQRLEPRLAAGQGDAELLQHLSLRPKGGVRIAWRKMATSSE